MKALSSAHFIIPDLPEKHVIYTPICFTLQYEPYEPNAFLKIFHFYSNFLHLWTFMYLFLISS